MRDPSRLERFLVGPGRVVGRRSYDQVFGWVRIVKDLGFPIAAFLLLWFWLMPRIDRLTEAIAANTDAVQALVCTVSPPDCIQVHRKGPP